MPYDIDTEPIVIKVPASVALPPGNITPAEWDALKTRMDDEEAKTLAETPGVVFSDPEEGDVLVIDDAGNVVNGAIPGGRLFRVRDHAGAFVDNINQIWVRDALYVEPHGSSPNIVYIRLNTGTTAGTVATGNHVHALPTTTHTPIAAQDYMSSGTRQLASTSVVLPEGKSCLVEAAIDPLQVRGGDPGPCHYRLILTIDGNQRSQPNNTNGYWAVQGVPKDAVWTHERTITGTGAAITVSASIAWVSGGGGFYTDAGDLVVTVTPNR